MSEYIIKLSDNSKTIAIPENYVDKETTSIALIGHGFPNYGDEQNENFIHMLENFSSDQEPHNAIKGQLWYKQNGDDTYELRICKSPKTESSDAIWDKLLVSSSGQDAPTNPSTGDIWYDLVNHQFKIFDSSLVDPDDPNSGWNVIGPQDVIHKETDTQIMQSNQTSSTTRFTLNKKLFQKDIMNFDDEVGHTGSLHLVTLKVLIKEVLNEGADATDSLRACAMIYRFVVRTLSSGSGNDISYNISIFGAPNYEIIAKSDNLTFTTDLVSNGGNIIFSINNTSTTNISYFVNGIDMEITRI